MYARLTKTRRTDRRPPGHPTAGPAAPQPAARTTTGASRARARSSVAYLR